MECGGSTPLWTGRLDGPLVRTSSRRTPKFAPLAPPRGTAFRLPVFLSTLNPQPLNCDAFALSTHPGLAPPITPGLFRAKKLPRSRGFMKTYLTYGLFIALGITLVSLILFFLGYHSDAAKLGTAQLIGTIAALVISIAFTVIGIKARRAEIPPTEPFGYGRAVAAGVMITLFAVLFGAVTTYVYNHIINPGFMDVMVQAQVEKWEAKGMSSSQIEGAEAVMRKMMHPAVQAAFGILFGMVFGTIISLIAAAFLKRPELPDHTATA
jgi:hypothetical protein